jgi:hypothetical protein
LLGGAAESAAAGGHVQVVTPRVGEIVQVGRPFENVE